MPYIENGKVKIHYRVEGSGDPIILQHGQGDSILDWYASGIVTALKTHYQLILVDARGHGRSDKPHTPSSYHIKHNVQDILLILDELGIDKCHYWGHSMGGRIGFGCARYAGNRFRSLIISSMSPYKRPKKERDLAITQYQKGLDLLLAERKSSEDLSEKEERKIRGNDLLAQAASLTAVRDFPNQVSTFKYITMPTLIYVGERDSFWRRGLEKSIGLIPQAQFLILPGLDHQETFERRDIIVPHVLKFLKNL